MWFHNWPTRAAPQLVDGLREELWKALCEAKTNLRNLLNPDIHMTPDNRKATLKAVQAPRQKQPCFSGHAGER